MRALYMKNDNGNSPSIQGGPVEASDKWFPELDISYFFTPNIAAELVLTYPQKHDVSLGGTDIGTIKQLPPTLLLQYHFMADQPFKPYVGVGLNYTNFSSVNLPAGVDIDGSNWGVAFQVGADYKLTRNWYLNADIKWVDIDTDVKAGGSTLTTLEVDPWLFAVGVGYRF